MAKVPVDQRVRASKGARKAFLAKVLASAPTDECIFWNDEKPQSYVNFGDGGRYFACHVIACEHRNGAKPAPEFEVAHRCGKRGCINPAHLRWATRLENTLDALGHGTQPVGEKRWTSKLTEAQARRVKYGDLRPSTQIGPELDVHPVTIRDIRQGRTWKHI